MSFHQPNYFCYVNLSNKHRSSSVIEEKMKRSSDDIEMTKKRKHDFLREKKIVILLFKRTEIQWSVYIKQKDLYIHLSSNKCIL